MGRIEFEQIPVPAQSLIEFYIEGLSGSFDKKGPVVSLDINTGRLVLLPGFCDRVQAWRESYFSNNYSPVNLAQLPSTDTWNDFVNNKGYYDFQKRVLVGRR